MAGSSAEESFHELAFVNRSNVTLLEKIKDEVFDIESFISERVCEFANFHEQTSIEDKKSSALTLNRVYYHTRG